ncbi:38119_t:CDS:1, partial [Gigaspora margarita]
QHNKKKRKRSTWYICQTKHLVLTQLAVASYNKEIDTNRVNRHDMSYMKTDLPDKQYDNEQYQTKKICNQKPFMNSTIKYVKFLAASQNSNEKSGDVALSPKMQI